MNIGKQVKMYMDFVKFRLASLVIISALSGYLFVGASDGLEIFYLLFGGFLVTAASNGSNQIWERELDILMNRTGKRPLPLGNMTVNHGLFVVAICLLPGLWMLYQLNLGSMLLGLAAFVSYVFIYTPMKRVSPWAVFVGAFPGAIPPLLGAVAGSDSFGLIPEFCFLCNLFGNSLISGQLLGYYTTITNKAVFHYCHQKQERAKPLLIKLPHILLH